MDGGAIAAMLGLAAGEPTRLIAGLTRRHITVACAESLTGGLLTAVLTDVPGASAVVRGGLIVYATDLKHSLAGVDADLLSARGPVDPDVAVGLADGVRVACHARIGVGLTGVAGPDPQHGVPVGTWYVAVTGRTASGAPFHEVVAHHPDRRSIPPQRADVRAAAVRCAVDLLTTVTGSH